VQPAYGIGFPKELYLWIPVLGNIVAVFTIPLAGALFDRIGRRPMYIPGILSAGILTTVYLCAISIHSVPLVIAMSLIGWGIVYQGYNAIVPSFWPELFTTRVRVSGTAIGQNIGLVITAFLPMLFAAVAPPGSSDIVLMVGGTTLAVVCLAALSALTARETYRIRTADLGRPDAVPVDMKEYRLLRAEATR
jgi:MFS family permease